MIIIPEYTSIFTRLAAIILRRNSQAVRRAEEKTREYRRRAHPIPKLQEKNSSDVEYKANGERKSNRRN